MAKALGRGLDALIAGANKAKQSATGSMTVDIDKIRANPSQPRKTFGSQKMDELIKSVKADGVFEPIIVKEVPEGGYELIAGERRYRAAKAAGLKTIPAVIKNLSHTKQLEIALKENILREDLNPIEEANSYKQLMEMYTCTQEELSEKIGRNRATIANMVRLLKLPSEIQDYIVSNEVQPGHAKVLLGIEDENRQKALAAQIAKTNMSVRELEALVLKDKPKKYSPTQAKLMPELRAIEEKLKILLGTKVKVKGSYKKGKIEIEYYKREDLDRIIEVLDL